MSDFCQGDTDLMRVRSSDEYDCLTAAAIVVGRICHDEDER